MIPVLPLSQSLRPSPVPLLRPSDTRGVRLDREAAAGRLVTVRPGVFTPSDEWRTLAPWGRYLARVHAVALQQPDAVFSHESAAALLGLPLFGDPDVVHVLSGHATARETAGIRVHTTADARELVDIGGVVVTSPVEVAVDLARARHPAVALAVADAVLRLDPLASVEQLVARNEARSSSRGRRRARWVLHRADALAETALESVSRAVVEWLGFPAPELQVVVATAVGDFTLDMRWPDAAIGGETDGRLKYDGRYGDPADVVWREKQREDALRRELKGLARWGWAELRDPMSLRRILLAAGLRPVAPLRSDSLFSLRSALAGGSTP
ncbi:hypothetical protein [Microbacterium sp. GXF7504]